MTQTTLDRRLHLGNQAKELIENEAFIAAFEATEKEVIDEWMKSPARDSTGRELLWQYLMLLRKVRANLQTTLETGKLAQLELQHKQTLAERARGMFSLAA